MTDAGHDRVRSGLEVLGREPEPKAARYRRASIVGIAVTAGLLLAFAFITGTLSTKRRGADVPKPENASPSIAGALEGLEKLPKTYSAAFSADQSAEGRTLPPSAVGPSVADVHAASPSETLQPSAPELANALFVKARETDPSEPDPMLNTDSADPAAGPQAGAPSARASRREPQQKLYEGDYHSPPAGFAVQAGDIIEGALLTTLNSDLPGVALAQVTRDVFDHASGQTLLIPHGSRIFGHYDSRIGYGQNRASVLWDRIVMPNGSSVELKGMIGADDRGASGLSGSVDDHIGPIARAIGLSTVLVTGAALAQNAGSRSTPNLVLNDAQGGAAAAASEVGGRFVERDLNRKPTITVPSGWPVLIVVDKDLEVRPYQSGSPAGEPRDAGVSRPNPRDQALRPRPVAAF